MKTTETKRRARKLMRKIAAISIDIPESDLHRAMQRHLRRLYSK